MVCVFPVPGGALNQYAIAFFELFGDFELFPIGGFAQQNIFILISSTDIGSEQFGGGLQSARFQTENLEK